MKTNQMMTVKVGEFGTFEIGHLTKMGKLNDVFEIGNIYRLNRGLRTVELQEWLRLESTWEYIIVRSASRENGLLTKSGATADLNFTILKDQYNKVDYSLMMAKYSNVIYSKKGKYGGTWADLRIMLDLATYLDPVLKDEMYEVFINHKILYFRDLGGDNFKEFNRVVDMLLDLNGYSKVDVYQYVAIELRKKQNILDTKGYNEKDHNSKIQETRAKWLEHLTFVVRVGFVKSFHELVELIKKL
jgi:hypothetical protein